MRQSTVTPKIRARCSSTLVRSDRTKSQKWQVNSTHGSLTVGVTGKSVGHLFFRFSSIALSRNKNLSEWAYFVHVYLYHRGLAKFQKIQYKKSGGIRF